MCVGCFWCILLLRGELWLSTSLWGALVYKFLKLVQVKSTLSVRILFSGPWSQTNSFLLPNVSGDATCHPYGVNPKYDDKPQQLSIYDLVLNIYQVSTVYSQLDLVSFAAFQSFSISRQHVHLPKPSGVTLNQLVSAYNQCSLPFIQNYVSCWQCLISLGSNLMLMTDATCPALLHQKYCILWRDSCNKTGSEQVKVLELNPYSSVQLTFYSSF